MLHNEEIITEIHPGHYVSFLHTETLPGRKTKDVRFIRIREKDGLKRLIISENHFMTIKQAQIYVRKRLAVLEKEWSQTNGVGYRYIPEPQYYGHHDPYPGPALVYLNEERFEDIREGDVIRLSWVQNYGGHGATMIVEKKNRRSLKCREIFGSYKSGGEWSISFGTTHSVHIETQYMSAERLAELKQAWMYR